MPLRRKSKFVALVFAAASLVGLVACTAILGDFTTDSTSPAGGSDAGTDSNVTGDGAPAPGTFKISAPVTAYVRSGATAQLTIDAQRNAFSDPISVSITGLPANVTAAALTINGDNGNLVLNASAAATIGDHSVATVTGSSGSLISSVSVDVTVSGPTGAVDPSFPAALPFDPTLGTVDDAVALADGKALLFGTFHKTAGDAPALVLRINPDATVDSSFTVGAIATNAGASPIAAAIAGLVQPDGKILVAWLQGASSVLNVTRLNVDGALDTTWHDPTTATASTSLAFPLGTPPIVPLSLTANGSVVTAQVLDSSDVQVFRFTSSGDLDQTLGAIGHYGTTSFAKGAPVNSVSTSTNTGTSIFELASGAYVWLGDGASTFSGQVLARTTSAFLPDTTFGPSGTPNGWEWGNRYNDVMGESVVVGTTLYTAVEKGGSGCVTDVDFCLSQWNLGATDATGGVDVCPDPSTTLGCADTATRLIAGPNNTLFAAGYSVTLSVPVAARFTIGPPLAVDTSFGTGGVTKLREAGGAEAVETPVAIVPMSDGTTLVFNHDTQYPIQRLWP